MSFLDLFRPGNNRRSKSTLSYEPIKTVKNKKRVHDSLNKPSSYQSEKVEDKKSELYDDSRESNLEWQKNSTVLANLKSRLSSYIEDKPSLNVIELSPRLMPSTFNWIQQFSTSHAKNLNYKNIDVFSLTDLYSIEELESKATFGNELESFIHEQLFIKQTGDYQVDLILGWHYLQYLPEELSKKFTNVLQRYCHKHTLFYVTYCHYLKDNTHLELTYHINTEDDDKEILSATHKQQNITDNKLKYQSYSAGKTGDLLKGFDTVKVNCLRNPDIYESLSRFH